MISTSSLFAYSAGSVVVAPELGIGFTYPQASLVGKDNADDDANQNMGLYWSLGFTGSYFFTENLALISGLTLEHNSSELEWKDANGAGDKFTVEFDQYRLVLPIGARFHYSMFMVGGGLHLSTIVSNKATFNWPGAGDDETGHLHAKAALGFFIDAGVDIKTADKNSLLVFLRFKDDLTYFFRDRDFADSEGLFGGLRNLSLSLNASYSFQMN
ncbi:MAG: hypothetical protein FWG13_06805 [Leptospirales bacterium]|nr:hypothetical protein [Leptospirales bacterium]